MSLDKLMKDISKQSGVHISMLDDENSPCVVKGFLSTGCLVLDGIMGGGLPIGRITEIYGDASTGKSLIASQVAALAQEDGNIVLYIDTESAVSKAMMEEVGVDTSKLIYAAPDTVEDVFRLMEQAIESNAEHKTDKVMLVIWDSIAATSAAMEMDADYGKATMGRHAQLISQSLRKITRIISKSNACVLFLNQTREKLGIMFGDSETTFGGKAVSFHSSIRVRLRHTSKLKEGKKIVGIQTVATVVKNKVAMPYREAVLPIFFGHGIDDSLSTFEFLKANDIIKNAGGYFKIDLGGEEKTFKRVQWTEIMEANYQAIEDYVYVVLEA